MKEQDIYKTKEGVERFARFYNMGSDYSTATVIQVAGGWKVKII